MTSLTWGIIGTGNIASSMAAALRLVPGARLGAVASRTSARAEAFAAEWDIPRAYGDRADLLADASVDIVYVATPNARHKDDVLAALAAGKHVLCEKPLTTSAADTEACIAAARAADRFLMEAMWTVFFPAMVTARDLVASGAIGTPRHLSASFISHRDPRDHPNLFDPAIGGGASLDLGIYPIVAALLLCGPVARWSAERIIGPTGVDEMVAMALAHDNGALSQLACGFRADLPVALRLTGETGSLEMPRDFHCPQTLIVTDQGRTQERSLPPTGKGYAHEVAEVHRCLAEGRRESPLWPLSRSLDAARMLDRLQRS